MAEKTVMPLAPHAKAARALAKLTPSQRRAIAAAWQASWGEWFVPTNTRSDVRAQLIALGLASRRSAMPLLTLGIEVRELILSSEPNNGVR